MKAATFAVWCGLAVVLLVVVGAGARGLMRGSRDAGGAPTSVPSPRATFLQGGGDYGAVPDFSLTERSGRTVTRQELIGRFWIADFIFTRCTGSCPILSARMVSLVKSLPADDLTFVTFSVDPEFDTPAVLARYAQGLGAADGRWIFLTGPHETLHHVIGDGFHLSVAQAPPARPTDDATAGDLITHSDRFVLVDRAGRIRGYYHGNDEETVGALVADLEKLRQEPPR